MPAIASECFTFVPCSEPFSSKAISSYGVRWKDGLCSCSKGPENGSDQSKDDKQKVDWDKAWSSYREKKKKPFWSMFDMEKYVTRDPPPSNYPLSEEVDPLKRTERSTLRFWTDPKFTVAGFGVILLLFIYMVVIVGAPPPK